MLKTRDVYGKSRYFKNPLPQKVESLSDRPYETLSDFDKALFDMGVDVIGTGLGPVYRYKGISVAAGIDEPTTIEKHWTLLKHNLSIRSPYPKIGSYRKKYARVIEMVDGKPVKRFIKEVYKEYDERNNPDEFLTDLKAAVDELERRLPSLRWRAEQYKNRWLSTLKTNHLIRLHPITWWKDPHPNGVAVLENGVRCKYFAITENDWMITSFNEYNEFDTLYMISVGAFGDLAIKESHTGDAANAFLDILTQPIRSTLGML